MEVTKQQNVKFSQFQFKQIEKAIEEYNFKNASEVIREGMKVFFKFLEIKNKFEDPNVSRKFVEETEKLLQAEKEFDRLHDRIGKFTDEELERYFFVMSLERNSRQKTKVKTLEDNRERLQKGGELIPKVGYRLVNRNDYEYYEPIEPPNQYNDGKEWKELSEIDKITLRDDLTAKLSELQKKYGNDDKITAILPHTIQQINERIEKEKNMIR
jgi:Arc/MetJ-type ribon-helix-helix transcriptional regulator